MSVVKGLFDAMWVALKALFYRRRMTLKYPEQRVEIPEGYTYDYKKGIGLPGYKGRHILFLDKCTGCQLCAIACENIARCIEMVPVEKSAFPSHVIPKALAAAPSFPQNKKSIWPQIDFGSCVFCGFCVDACPFDALYMTGEHELASYDKKSLIYTPAMLAEPPRKKTERIVEAKIDKRGFHHG